MDHLSRYWFSIIAISIMTAAGACGSPSASQDGGGPVLAQSQPQQDRVVGRTESEKAAFDTFVSHESRFKDHYRANYTTSGYEYNQYRPAYQHGFELALDKRYSKMDWNEVELQARRTWDEGTMGLWDRYKDAVRYGWEQGVALDRG